MYSLFIGLTLGGVPQLLQLCRPFDLRVGLAALLGLGAMGYLTFGLSGSSLPHSAPVIALIGALAASSMILPGVSGSYILLIFGFYDLVIGSLSPGTFLAEPGESARIVLPFTVGVAAGIALLSNVLKVLLARFPRPSHGALLGLLVGAVLGLYPFQEAVRPELQDLSLIHI